MHKLLLALGAVVLLAAPSLPAPTAGLASLPTGEWTLIANGRPGALDIQAVRPDGSADVYYAPATVDARWDEATRRLTFTRVIQSRNARAETRQVYTGILHDPDPDGHDTDFHLSGTFTHSVGGRPSERPAYGWNATLAR